MYDDSFRISDPAEIAKVESPCNTLACSGGVSLAPMQPFGDPHERERGGIGVAHEVERRGDLFQGAPSINVCQTLL
jgi:hypothetical protein